MDLSASFITLLSLALLPIAVLAGLGEFLFRHPRLDAYDFINPNPALVSVPIFLVGLAFRKKALLAIPVLVPSLLFWFWAQNLSGREISASLAIGLFLILVVLNALWLVWQVNSANRDRSLNRVKLVLAANGVAIAIGGILFAVAHSAGSASLTLLAHWAVFAWLAWCAFPWFGSST